MSVHLDQWTLFLILFIYACGLVASVLALFQSRTPQGAAAWVLGLIFFPVISLPLFILFGKRRLRRYGQFNVLKHYPYDPKKLEPFEDTGPCDPLSRFFCNSEHPIIKGNRLKLLIDGKNIFPEMLSDIDRAQEFILLQMFIIRCDELGDKFLKALARKAAQGVKVYILYENLGVSMNSKALDDLRAAGVQIGQYNPTRRGFKLANFRNHKKLLIVDNEVGFWGGVNIGDDYLGKDKDIGFWRDTNVKVEGPALTIGKINFAKDWEWSQKTRIEINWEIPSPKGEASVFIVNSDPSSDQALNLLQHIELINQASERVWITNPYLVPPQGLMDALLIARIRGVEVKILLPGVNDNPLVSHASELYVQRLLEAGVMVYKFEKGMVHQKVLLSDNQVAVVGSSNFDFRSMYINFENGMITTDKAFISEVEGMLVNDFSCSRRISPEDFKDQTIVDKLSARVCNILAPIL